MNNSINWQDIFLNIFEELNHIVKSMYLKDQGKIILGNVQGRNIKDDQYLEIDQVCQNHIINSLQTLSNSIKIYSEHGEFYTSNSDEVEYIIAPFTPFEILTIFFVFCTFHHS